MERFRKCPICFELLGKKIFQCHEGHITCHSCISRIPEAICLQCRDPFDKEKIRNRALEQLLNCARKDRRKTMTRLQYCSICTEVFGKEIYQCNNGHLICDSCKSKSSVICPNCTDGVALGPNGIRNLALEEILDLQLFFCKLKEHGCLAGGSRKALRNHNNHCPFISRQLCGKLGFENCTFQLHSATKEEVISHFQNEHECPLVCAASGIWFQIDSGAKLMSCIRRKRKAGSEKVSETSFKTLATFPDKNSPLFLLYWKMDNSSGFLAATCSKIWSAGYFTTLKYKVKLALIKQNTLPDQSSSKTFLTSGTKIASSIKGAPNCLKDPPIKFPISVMKENRFGTNDGDNLHATITLNYDCGTNRSPNVIVLKEV